MGSPILLTGLRWQNVHSTSGDAGIQVKVLGSSMHCMTLCLLTLPASAAKATSIINGSHMHLVVVKASSAGVK